MDRSKELVKEAIGIFLFFLFLFMMLSFISYYPNDSGVFTSSNIPVRNLMGKAGAAIADFFFYIFGLSSYFFLIFILLIAYDLFNLKKRFTRFINYLGYFFIIFSFSPLLSIMFNRIKVKGFYIRGGGVLGDELISLSEKILNPVGSSLFFVFLFIISLILSFNFSLRKALENLYLFLKEITLKYKIQRERKKREKIEESDKKINIIEREEKEKKKKEEKREKIILMPEETVKFKKNKKGKFELPPLSLLDSPPKRVKTVDDAELSNKKKIIEEKLREFNIDGRVVEYHPGPVISTFEYKPERGIKISQIIGLSEDLSLALKAENVMISRIKGKETLGIEIPNYNRQTIFLREILESDAYRNSKDLLTIVLGKNVRGKPFVTSLSRMPHLLIAGATGMGKSVAIHSIIVSILYRATPEEVNFILVDPKRLEFSVYEQLPHLKTKVVLDPKEASMALKWAIYEMENRLKKLALFQSRNIDMFNEKVKAIRAGKIKKLEDWPEDEIVPMPYIIIVIDELADLMMVASKDVETSVARLAQMARAAGIHLILATQRPSTDVITGTIKNNLPSRLALTVPSRHDSQTIIDTGGAEKLLGKGDMLFMPPASSMLIRVHGSFVSEEEVARVVKFLRNQTKPKFDSSVLSKGGLNIPQEEEDIFSEEGSEFLEALKIVIHTGKASASYLQRKMKIGYNKAARYIEMMEEKGIVGQAQGSKPRDVLVGEEYLEEILKKRFSG